MSLFVEYPHNLCSEEHLCQGVFTST